MPIFPIPAEDTDNIVLGDVSELADMKLRGHPLAATRCDVIVFTVIVRAVFVPCPVDWLRTWVQTFVPNVGVGTVGSSCSRS